MTHIVTTIACQGPIPLLIAMHRVLLQKINSIQQAQKVRGPETRHLPSRKSADVKNKETQVSRDEQDPILRPPGIPQCRSQG